MTFQSMLFSSVTYLYGAAGTELLHNVVIMKSNADRNSLPLARLMARSDHIN